MHPTRRGAAEKAASQEGRDLRAAEGLRAINFPARALRAIAAGASVFFAGAFIARLPGVGPWTLGLLSERLGSVTSVAACATLLGVLLWRRRGGILGSAAILAVTYTPGALEMLDATLTRRRSALLALMCLGIPWALHALNDLRKERSLPWIAWILAAGAGVGALAAFDGLPYRVSLPAIDAAAPPRGAPHIVLISLDTTRYDALFGQGAAGLTPRIERFAGTALRFPNTTAEASHTHPSMGSLLTSRTPIEHGSISTSAAINPSIPTLASHLRRSGYRTAGFLENPWLGPDFGLSEGYEYLHKEASLHRIEGWLTKNDAEPVFLHVHLFEPHGPYELREQFLRSAPRLDLSESRQKLGDTISAQFISTGETPGEHGLTLDDFQWLHRIYMTEVSAMDQWIGDFIELCESTLGNNTLFALTADHGEEFGDHGALHHGHTLYGELVHVPLLLRVPGVAPGTNEAPAGLIDVAPTLLDAARLQPLRNSAGSSLLAVDRSDSPRVSTRFFKGKEHLFAITSGEWKLHLRTFSGLDLHRDPLDFEIEAIPHSLELYRWRSDPQERVNLAPEHPDVVQQLQAELRIWHGATLERSARDQASERARPLSPETSDALRSFGYSGHEAGAK